MDDQEFNRQYDAAQVRGEFAQAVKKFVVDDNTALAALQELHEELQTLSKPENCPRRLYYLTNDLRDLLNYAHEYYQDSGNAMENELEFKDPSDDLHCPECGSRNHGAAYCDNMG